MKKKKQTSQQCQFKTFIHSKQ